MDRLKAFEIFKAVVDNGSFVKGAEAMNLSNSVTTRAVQDLETLLGVRLLHRTTRRLTLTAVGESVLKHAVGVLDSYDELAAISSMSSSAPAGNIRISVPAIFGICRLGPVLADFVALYPRVKLELRTMDDDLDLIEDQIDLALTVGRKLPQSLIVRKISVVKLGLYAAPSYLTHHSQPENPCDLRQHDCLVHSSVGRSAEWQFKNATSGEITSILPQGSLRSNNAEMLVSAAIHGTGIVLLPDSFVEQAVCFGSLQRLLPTWQIEPLVVHLAYASRRNQPLCVRRLVDHLAHSLSDTDSDYRNSQKVSAACVSEHGTQAREGSSRKLSALISADASP